MDDRRARSSRGYRNGQHGRPRPVAGRDDDREPRALPVLGRLPRSPVFVTARGTTLQQPGSGPCPASCFRGFRRGERHEESCGAGHAQDGPPLLAAVTRVEQLVRHGDPWTVAGFPGREDEGGHPSRRPRGCRLRQGTGGIRALVESVVQGDKTRGVGNAPHTLKDEVLHRTIHSVTKQSELRAKRLLNRKKDNLFFCDMVCVLLSFAVDVFEDQRT